MARRYHFLSCAAIAAAFLLPVAASAASSHGVVAVVDANHSSNWGGYNQGALNHALFHRVTGDWTVPTATQHQSGRAEYSSVWIGIGGGCHDDTCTTTDSTLIQTGTEEDVATNGAASYSAWYELIPAPSIAIPNLPVNPGDKFHADIAEQLPGLWNITLTNVTKAQSFTTTVPYTSTYGSAEWIVETPLIFGTNGAGFSAMPNLSRVTFTNAGTNGAPANLAAPQEMQLVNGSTVILTPSAPTGGTSFNACTYATSCPSP